MSDAWRSCVRSGLGELAAYHVPAVAAEVKLDANESPYAPPAELMAAIADAVVAASLHRYPDPRAARLRAAITADLGRSEDALVLGNGSDELIALLCATFAEPRPGATVASVVYPAPSFVVYRTAALASGMAVVEAPLGARFEALPEALAETIRRVRPSLVFVATPNNPTGTAWPSDALARLARDFADTVFVVDEAYVEYAGVSHLALLDGAPNLAVLRTYSKIGLAGLRIGVLVASAELAREVEKVRAPYNIGTLPQIAATLAITRFRAALSAHVAEVIAERERLAVALARLDGVAVFPSAANLVMIRVADAPAVWQGLCRRSVLVRNLDRPGTLAGCLRITVGTATENDRLLAALAAALLETTR